MFDWRRLIGVSAKPHQRSRPLKVKIATGAGSADFSNDYTKELPWTVSKARRVSWYRIYLSGSTALNGRTRGYGSMLVNKLRARLVERRQERTRDASLHPQILFLTPPRVHSGSSQLTRHAITYLAGYTQTANLGLSRRIWMPDGGHKLG